jgi:hypothetical protein
VREAIEQTASNFKLKVRTVKKIWENGDEEWKRLVKVEQSRRNYELEVKRRAMGIRKLPSVDNA